MSATLMSATAMSATAISASAISATASSATAMHDADAPISRLFAGQLVVPRAGTTVFLQPQSAAAVLSVAAQEARGPVYATQRRWPVYQQLANAAAPPSADAATSVGGTRPHIAFGCGVDVLPEGLTADLVVIRLPPEKAAFHLLLTDALTLLREGGRCLVAGATTEGIKSAARLLESTFGNVQVLARGGGHRVLACTRGAHVHRDDLHVLTAPYHDPSVFREHRSIVRGSELTWFSRPGVFSWEHLDEATEVLAATMDIPDGAAVLDLGSGAGILGAVAGRVSGTGAVTCVDADAEAVRCTARTMAASGVAQWRVLPSDGAQALVSGGDAKRLERGTMGASAESLTANTFDVVVTNPPFHTGKSTNLSLPSRFMTDSAAVLRPGGKLYLVANRTLPYERELEGIFGNRVTVHDGARFKVLMAEKQR